MVVDWGKRVIRCGILSRGRNQPHWRHPIALLASADYEVKAGDQMVVGVEEIKQEEFTGYSVREGLVTPTRTRERLDQTYMVAYGYGEVWESCGVQPQCEEY